MMIKTIFGCVSLVQNEAVAKIRSKKIIEIVIIFFIDELIIKPIAMPGFNWNNISHSHTIIKLYELPGREAATDNREFLVFHDPCLLS